MLGKIIKDAFKESDCSYGALRVLHDLVAEGLFYGLHRFRRLMHDKTRYAAKFRAPHREGDFGSEQYRHPPRRYKNKRLTQRGEGICLQLLDKEKSSVTVARLIIFR
ncbi:hypothetical protein [Rhizobium daejeonense]|uniref:hypothetical protein n=1 Tax=Rhizobium daejeonense TaxID=240521 RepID=UPI0013D0E197|nr:hypothetical protein [Rhizobium daejeonense]